MDVVVTEELRGASSHGREMIETEEAVEAVDLAESVEVQLKLSENGTRRSLCLRCERLNYWGGVNKYERM